MSKPKTKSPSGQGNKKKWLTLGLVGAALLLIPRRSSRQDSHYKNNLADDSLPSKEIEKLHTDAEKY